jgi:hypothetical protein
MKKLGEVGITTGIKFAGIVLVLATACSAQERLNVQNKREQKWPAAEAQKIYLSACSVVQGEFGGNRRLAPQVTLVLGAKKNEIELATREIRLTKWDSTAFAEGAVWLAFEELMPLQKRVAVAIRAVDAADSTVSVEQLTK